MAVSLEACYAVFSAFGPAVVAAAISERHFAASELGLV